MSAQVSDKLRERLDDLLKGLDETEARRVVEVMIDDYCLNTFGTTVVKELKTFSNTSKGKVSILQAYKEKLIIISSYGFELTGSITHQGKTKLILEERTKDECMERFDLSVS